jgi:biopolymer transport protein ExbD
MKFGRRIHEEVETIQMAPLIDVVFLTLIFFMVSSVYGALEREVDVKLPTADSGKAEQRTQGEIYINVLGDGGIVVNDRKMEVEELQTVLNRIAEYFPGGSVIIRGDNGVPLGRIIQVLDCCRKADIQDVSFAVTAQGGAS